MNVSGLYALPATPERVWAAIHDLDVLRRTLPDCQSLEQTGPGTYEGAARVGVAVIRGTYKGSVRLSEEREPQFLRVTVEARSGHAEFKGDGTMMLEPSGPGSLLTYAGVARVFGPVAAVGQRLVPSATKSLCERFLQNLEQALMDAAVP
jgi:carbon monoxide dehydrogenase subunit G